MQQATAQKQKIVRLHDMNRINLRCKRAHPEQGARSSGDHSQLPLEIEQRIAQCVHDGCTTHRAPATKKLQNFVVCDLAVLRRLSASTRSQQTTDDCAVGGGSSKSGS